MCKKLRLVSVLFILLSQFLLLAAPLRAEGPTPVIPSKLIVREDGTWSVSVQNGALVGTSARVSVDVSEPRLDPRIIHILMDHGVSSASILKQSGEFDVLINNTPAVYLGVSRSALDQAVESLAPDLAYLAPRVWDTNVSVALHVQEEREIDLSQRVAKQAKVRNVVDVGVTLTPDGQPLSAMGIPLATLGELAPLGIGDLVAQLDLTEADVSVDGFGVAVSMNGEEQLRVAVNPDLIESTTPLVYDLLARAYGPQDQQIVGYLTAMKDQISRTQVHLTAHFADTPQPEARRIQFDDPIELYVTPETGPDEVTRYALSLGADGKPIASLASWLQPPLSTLVAETGNLAVSWDGSTGSLVTAVGQERMPSIKVGEGFLQELGTIVGQPDIPWDVLTDIKIGVTLSKSGMPGYLPRLTRAQAEYAPTPMVNAVPRLVADRSGRLAVDIPALGRLEAIPGMDASPLTALLVSYPSLKSLRLAMTPGGIELGLNSRSLRVVMDYETRGNAIRTVPGLLPLLNVNIDPRLTQPKDLELFATHLRYDPLFSVGVDVTFLGEGESIPPGTLEEEMGSLGAFLGGLFRAP